MSLEELLKQKAELDRKITQFQNEGKNKAITDIRTLMADWGITIADITASTTNGRKNGALAGKTVAPKYKDDQGNTWTGRGLKPKWLTIALAAGKKIEDFAV